MENEISGEFCTKFDIFTCEKITSAIVTYKNCTVFDEKKKII